MNTLLLLIFSLIFLPCVCQEDALSNKYQEIIKNLVHENPHQLTIAEYSTIAIAVARKAPCNMLIFGVGRDSSLWIDLNKNGYTAFLEDNSTWLDYAKNSIPDINAYLVTYDTQNRYWKRMLKDIDRSKLMLALPQELSAIKWDLIFVDGPVGVTKKSPGRMKSIFTASILAFAHDNVDVFVHDCDRVVEKTYTDVFLLPSNLKETVGKLRHYLIKK